MNKKNSWNEDDELMLKAAVVFIETGWLGQGKSQLVYWLKSIKDRTTWKPTEKQMDAFNLAIVEANSVDTVAGDEAAEILTSLYEQLKKL